MMYLIYKTVNLVNGKFYIGMHRTDNLEDKYIGSGRLLWKAIAKYGINNFKKEVIYICESEEEMLIKEKEFIAPHLGSELCYNIAEGGDKILKHSEATKAKISQSHIGILHSDESKLKMSLNRKGQIPWNKGIPGSSPKSEEWRLHVSSLLKGRISPMKGRKMSENSKAQISASMKGQNPRLFWNTNKEVK